MSDAVDSAAVHRSHCFQGEWKGVCKYGDESCPAEPPRKPEGWTSDKWATPWPVVRSMETEFGPFDLDPCCEEHTAKASTFYTEGGLDKPWFGRVWLNPPYSNPRPWLDRAIRAASEGCTVVAILPVRTDTRWFHEAVLPYAELRFLRGRVKWIGWQGTPIPSPKDPSLLAIYRPRKDTNGVQ